MARSHAVVAIGGSAGALDALGIILSALPAGYPIPVVVLLHLPSGRPSVLPEIFRSRTVLACVAADDHLTLREGHVYFAPPDHHLRLRSDLTLALSVEPPVHLSRPAIDPLFESVANACGKAAVGVVLSGASRDGSAGLLAIRRAGGIAVAQDPASAPYPLMPEAAIAEASPDRVLAPEAIGVFLASLAAGEGT